MFVVSPCLVFVGKYLYLVLYVLLGFVALFPYFSWIRQVSTPMILLRLYIGDLTYVCEDFPYLGFFIVTASSGVSISYFYFLEYF